MTSVTANLVFVSGAPGAGKSALVPLVAERLAGRFVVLDMDEILEPGGTLLGHTIAAHEAAEIWPRYNQFWMRLVFLIARSGLPVVLFGPLLPAEVGAALGQFERPVDVRYVLLDCSDVARRVRLLARGWREAEIADALVDAESARSAIAVQIANDGSREDSSQRVAEFARLAFDNH